jgi:hypothetical protein
MADTARKTQMTFTPLFLKRQEEHKAEVARLRAEIGDVEAAFDAWVRESFDPVAVAQLSADWNGPREEIDDDDDYLDGW